MKKTHCRHGHEISVVGRYSNGACAECERRRILAYKNRNRARIRADGRAAAALYRRVLGRGATR